MSKHRGQYAQRNAVIYPWFKRLDLNVTQDIAFKTGKNTHTIRLTLDLVNAFNLINKNWGLYKIPTTTTVLKFDKMAADGKTPIFSMPYQDGANLIPYSNAYKNDTNIGARWQMQFGIRYLFN